MKWKCILYEYTKPGITAPYGISIILPCWFVNINIYIARKLGAVDCIPLRCIRKSFNTFNPNQSCFSDLHILPPGAKERSVSSVGWAEDHHSLPRHYLVLHGFQVSVYASRDTPHTGLSHIHGIIWWSILRNIERTHEIRRTLKSKSNVNMT